MKSAAFMKVNFVEKRWLRQFELRLLAENLTQELNTIWLYYAKFSRLCCAYWFRFRFRFRFRFIDWLGAYFSGFDLFLSPGRLKKREILSPSSKHGVISSAGIIFTFYLNWPFLVLNLYKMGKLRIREIQGNYSRHMFTR